MEPEPKDVGWLDIPPSRPSAFRSAWIVLRALIVMYVAAYAVCSVLVSVARSEATGSMVQICDVARRQGVEASLREDLFYAGVRQKLGALLRNFGRVRSASFRIVTCEFSGRPCLVRWDLRSDSGSASAELYFYGRECHSADRLWRSGLGWIGP